MTEEFTPGIDNMINSLDGSIQSQGIKVGYRAWLDMGSEEYGNTPPKVQAAAYQAAQVTGWGDEALIDIMLVKHKHLTEHLMAYTIECLKDLAKHHPFEVEKTKEKE